MEKAKAVVFDLGNVLLEFDYGKAARQLREHCELTEEELLKALNQSPLLHRYESGLMTSQEFFEQIRKASRFCRSYEDFTELFADIFTPVTEMIELQSSLREAGIPTFIFSNTNEIAIQHISKQYPFFRGFSGYIYSYEERAMKPERSIYEAVERKAGCRGGDLLYIDDRHENVEQGKRMGWQVILHRSPRETIPIVQATCCV